MGTLTLPTNGIVYLDANAIIYTVERIEPYATLLQPLWDAAGPGAFGLASSEITLLEVLVKPFKLGNTQLEGEFRTLLQSATDVLLLPISRPILEQAARLRAATNLKTPDAIHAATSLIQGCALFVTNDAAFRRVSGLPVTILSELAAP